jgi:DNA-binding response OmpR family regulator
MLEHSPDVILLDLRMPVMNGIETVQQIRQNKIFHETIIIAVSASAYEDDRKESLQVGCNDFLTKPIHLEELLSLLQKYLSLAWVYEETIQEPSPKDESIQVHSSSNIVLPAKDREVLLKFAASGRVKPLLEYLADIEERDPKYQLLTEEIRRFAKMFQLKAVIEKLQ